MPMVDPWGSTNQGLAQLGDTFDTLNARRRQDIQDTLMMERDRRAAEKDAIGMESARMTLDEQKRKIENLRTYDEARKAQEAGFASATVPTNVPNPEYRAAVPAGLNSTMTYAGESNETIPGVPAQGLPTMAGNRPMNDSEMNHARISLALQHGNLDEIAKLGHFIDVTDKVDQRGITKITQLMTAINSMQNTMGSGVALAQGKKMAIEMGVDPAIADQMTLSPQGYVSTPDGQGGTIITMKSPDGKYHVVHSAAKEPKSPSQIDMEIKAAQGDPLAVKIIKDQEARKIRLKQIEAGSAGAGAGGGPYDPNAPVGIPGERNEAALKGLTANEAATVKGLVDYRIAPLSGFVLKSPWGQKMIGAAQMYDPSFDYTQYQSRQKAKNDFTSGKSAVNLRALNTAVYHLDTLDKKLAALNNTDFPTYNEIANKAITAVGDKRVTGAKGAVTAVVSELAAVFKGMGATDQEINAWRDNFPIAGSRAQQKEAVNTGIELMFGRVKALESQYEGAMGRAKDFRFLSPESRKILKGLGANVDSIDEVAGQSGPASSTPKPAGGVTHRYNPATGLIEEVK